MENNGKNLEEKLCDMFTPGTKENKELGECLHKKVCFINSIRRAYSCGEIKPVVSSVASCYNAIKEVITGYEWPDFVKEYKHAMVSEARHAPEGSYLYTDTDDIMQKAKIIAERDNIWSGIVLPEFLQNDEAKRVLNNAVKQKLISKEGTMLKWEKGNVLLAYLFGRLVCGDRIYFSPRYRGKIYEKGAIQLPEKAIYNLFGIKNLGNSRRGITSPPRGYEIIDICFEQ